MHVYARTVLSILLACSVGYADAARLYGIVNDAAGGPLPYANVLLSGTTLGTTANASGEYTIDLPIGKHRVAFSMIGYEQHVDTVSLSESGLRHDVILSPVTYQLSEVAISSGGEDPAYAIIRRARDNRSRFRKEVTAYRCESYVKSTQRLVRFPKQFMGQKVDVGDMVDSVSGIYYLSESVSEISFKSPDKVKEKMVSSKVSGNPRAYSFNQGADLVGINLYDPLLKLSGLVPRGVVSPISDDCFLYYRYQLQGAFMENGRLINKIKVIPRRKNDPAFSGDLFIVDDNWRVHGFDLLLTKEQQLQFVDTFRLIQSGVEVDGNRWMPFSNSLYFHFSIFGFEGAGDILGVFQSYDMQPDFPGRYFNGEVLDIDSTANRRDSAYWAERRPVPLTGAESSDYVRKDSIQEVKNSPAYLDSTDKVSNKFKAAALISGYRHRNSLNRRMWSIEAPIGGLQFNTVEGWNLSLSGEYRSMRDDNDSRGWKFTPLLRYGFSNKQFNPKAAFEYRYDSRKQSVFGIEGGSEVNQFNRENPISPVVNSFYSLSAKKNYMKIYQERFMSVSHRSEIANGLMLGYSAAYAYRIKLDNSSDFSFDDGPRQYTINDPVQSGVDTVDFSNHSSWTVSFRARFRIGQKYISRPEGRYLLGSVWPTIRLEYTWAIPVTANAVDYQRIRLSVDDEMDFGLLGSFRYKVASGRFLSKSRVEFMDYKHFNGNQTYLSSFRLEDFMGLDYYDYSTTDQYGEVHAEQHFNGLLLNKLPLIRKLRLDELVFLHALSVEGFRPVFECGAGFEKLNVFRFQYFVSLSGGGRLSSGVVLGVKKAF
ncbi:MAG: DUF5686 and carboxypeptidase regulatory-like domain-containing protein [Bacteroidota bacterium]